MTANMYEPRFRDYMNRMMGGMLFVGSGYAVGSAATAGNVLLAFSVEGLGLKSICLRSIVRVRRGCASSEAQASLLAEDSRSRHPK